MFWSAVISAQFGPALKAENPCEHSLEVKSWFTVYVHLCKYAYIYICIEYTRLYVNVLHRYIYKDTHMYIYIYIHIWNSINIAIRNSIFHMLQMISEGFFFPKRDSAALFLIAPQGMGNWTPGKAPQHLGLHLSRWIFFPSPTKTKGSWVDFGWFFFG